MLAWMGLGIIIEPDWGYQRTTFVFIHGLITGKHLGIERCVYAQKLLLLPAGSLTSASMSDHTLSVGASGGIFGMIGGLLVYVVEFWPSIPMATCLFLTVIFSLILGLLTSLIPHVDAYAHAGGCVGGFLGACMTFRSFDFPACSSVVPQTPDVEDPFSHVAIGRMEDTQHQAAQTLSEGAGRLNDSFARNTTSGRAIPPRFLGISRRWKFCGRRPLPTHFPVQRQNCIILNASAVRNGLRCTFFVTPPKSMRTPTLRNRIFTWMIRVIGSSCTVSI